MHTENIDDEEYYLCDISAEGLAKLFLLQSIDAELKRAYAQIAVLKAAAADYDPDQPSVQAIAQVVLIGSMDAEVKRAYAQIAVLKSARATYVEALRNATTVRDIVAVKRPLS